MIGFFKNAESTKIFVFVEFLAFDEAVFGELVVDFARWAEIGG